MDPAILLALKIVLPAAVASCLWFLGDYTNLSRPSGGWWTDPVGRTLVLLDLLIVVTLIPACLSVFLHFNRLDNAVAGWLQVVLLGLITPLMLYRSVLFRRLRNQARAGEKTQKEKP